ncbi:MAG: hypothetical protein WBG32_00140 [Nodosilinea sp.]
MNRFLQVVGILAALSIGGWILVGTVSLVLDLGYSFFWWLRDTFLPFVTIAAIGGFIIYGVGRLLGVRG